MKYKYHNWPILLCLGIICGFTVIASMLVLWENVFSYHASRVSYEMPQQRGTVIPDSRILALVYDTINSGSRLATFYMGGEQTDWEEDDWGEEPDDSVLHASDNTFLRDDTLISFVGNILNWNDLSDLPDVDEEDDVEEEDSEEDEILPRVLAAFARDNAENFREAVFRTGQLNMDISGLSEINSAELALNEMAYFEYDTEELDAFLADYAGKYLRNIESGNTTLALERITGTIDDNLFDTMGELGEGPQLALSIMQLFGSEINFIRHIKPGSTITVLVEKEYDDGVFKDYGRILAARLNNGGKVYEAFLFRDPFGKPQYYNSKGENLHKTLLQSPLAITRKTSGFSYNRLHPILNISRPHLGVDYAAPTGTPVKAVGNGVVSERGWSGGFGNLVILKHDGGLESMYGHLSGFARGLRPGQKVKQGQTIGFVGSTGMATGSHLDFRLRQNGKYINPEKVVNPRSAPVMAALQKEFQKIMKVEKAHLDGEKVIASYTPTSIVPAKLPLTVEKALEKELMESQQASRNMGRRRIPAGYASRRKVYTARQRKILSAIRRKIGREFAARFQTKWR